MIFYIVWGLLTAGFLLWLWNVLPHRVDDWEYEYQRDSSNGFAVRKRVAAGKRWEYYFETWWTGVLGVLGIIIAWLVATLSIAMIFSAVLFATIKDYSLDDQHDSKLTALRTDSALSGTFAGTIFLSAGYVSEKPTFNFLYETSDSGVKVGQVRASDSVVYEDEQDAPYYTKYTWNKYDPFWAPFSVGKSTTYSFHVPEGSVVSNYEVNP